MRILSFLAKLSWVRKRFWGIKKMFGQSAAGKNASKQYRFAAGKIQRSKKKHLATAKNKFAAERIHSRRSGKNDTAAGKTVGGKEKNVRGRKHPATEKTQLCSRKNRRNRKKQIRSGKKQQPLNFIWACLVLCHWCQSSMNVVQSGSERISMSSILSRLNMFIVK